MINLLILTLIVLTTSVVNAFVDNYIIKKKWGKVKNLNHTSRTFIRVTIFWISIYLIFPYSLLNLILTSAYSVLLFNIIFDLLLNHLRKLSWYYDGKDAITDKLSGHFGSDLNETVAYIELGIKIFITLGLAIWILLI